MEMKKRMEPLGKLRVIMDRTGWNQKELAGKIGVSPKSMSFWMNKVKTPGAKNIAKIDELYHEVLGKNPLDDFAKNEAMKYRAQKEADENEAPSTLTEEEYYTAKAFVASQEPTNKSKIFLFASMGDVRDNWYKIGGRSLLFYRYLIAPRLNRVVKSRDDDDRLHRFKHGICSVKYGKIFMADAQALGYKVSKLKDMDVIVVELGRGYTSNEIRKLEQQAKRDRDAVKEIIRPENCYPNLEVAIYQLARYMSSKLKKLDAAFRDLYGREMFIALMNIQKTYFRMANGRMSVVDAKYAMLESVDDLMAMIGLVDESGFLNIVARTKLGENVLIVKKEIMIVHETKTSNPK